mmetsp:Transcript_8443/g.52803  ORF Transcript_8443/g.52803 Transcript_8443/m.52803 type:complete len:118 (-) Transcript_8443:187-540(-)
MNGSHTASLRDQFWNHQPLLSSCSCSSFKVNYYVHDAQNTSTHSKTYSTHFLQQVEDIPTGFLWCIEPCLGHSFISFLFQDDSGTSLMFLASLRVQSSKLYGVALLVLAKTANSHQE